MFLTLRIDLDYVPWDSPDAHEFGHGEPAAFLNMKEDGAHVPGPHPELIPFLAKERDVIGWGSEGVGTDAGDPAIKRKDITRHPLRKSASTLALDLPRNLKEI